MALNRLVNQYILGLQVMLFMIFFYFYFTDKNQNDHNSLTGQRKVRFDDMLNLIGKKYEEGKTASKNVSMYYSF